MPEEAIKTSERGWVERLAGAYRARRHVVLVDDARVGLDPSSQTLLQMASRARMAPREIGGVAVALGMSAAGAAMLAFAWFDPEPTSKLGLLVGGGLVCVLGGGMQAVRILTRDKPPRVTVTPRGIDIRWE